MVSKVTRLCIEIREQLRKIDIAPCINDLCLLNIFIVVMNIASI